MAILVEYKGGGYDGCFWEWNYFYVSNKGEYKNVRATGYKGAKTEEDMRRILKERDSSTYIYNLREQKDIDEFSRESNVANILGVFKWLSKNDDESYEAPCSRCGGHHDLDYFTFDHDNYRGDGGIGIQYCGGLVCLDCFSDHSCFLCNRYMDERDEERAGLAGECEYCIPEEPDEDDLDEGDRVRLEELRSEVAWLGKDWLDIPDREENLKKAERYLETFERNLRYLYSDNEDLRTCPLERMEV
jgi:hypothetical protein